MNSEIEAKFLDVDFEAVRKRLSENGAVLEMGMRPMRRVTIDNGSMKSKDAFLRVRDQGDKVTLTYKQFDSLSVDGTKEIEVTVNSFEDTIRLLSEAGLPYGSYQESRRETWRYKNTEVVLDEWPWLKPYIEIEGPSESDVRETAGMLGYDWGGAVFGDVMAAYRGQYPHLSPKDTIGNIPKVAFGDPLPDLLKQT